MRSKLKFPFKNILCPADNDIADPSAANMQIMILSIELWALTVGLKINGLKTEFMVYGHEDPLAPAAKFHLSSGLELQKVLDFKYLGTWDRTAMSSAKSRSVTYTAGEVQRDLVPTRSRTQNPSVASGTALRIIQSITNTKRYGASVSP